MNNKISMHQNGPCKVQYGSIYGFNGGEITTPTVLVDVSDENVLIILKYGNEDWVKDYYNKMVSKYHSTGDDWMCDGLRLITFNVKTGFVDYDNMTKAKLSVDEVCTLINWMNNAIATRQLMELFESDEATVHKKLQKLAEIGF